MTKPPNATCPECEEAPREVVEHSQDGVRWWTLADRCTGCLAPEVQGNADANWLRAIADAEGQTITDWDAQRCRDLAERIEKRGAIA